ncbi:MAG: hypothetical protein QM478_13650 [Flavobacteriaceae bacterium]
MKKIIGTLIMKFGGWTEYYPDNYNLEKSVLISAPYTSFWDYVYTIASFWKNEYPIKVLFEQKSRLGIRSTICKICDGINLNEIEGEMTHHMNDVLNSSDKMMLIVPTEGSRKKVDKWKTEFYEIARYADVPVLLGYLDYVDKTVGIGATINLTKDFKSDMNKIQGYYKNFSAKYPQNYNEKIC